MTRDRTRFQLSKKGGTRDFKGWYWYRQDSTQLSYFLEPRWLHDSGAACRVRTCDPRLRRPLLYPTELMPQRKEHYRVSAVPSWLLVLLRLRDIFCMPALFSLCTGIPPVPIYFLSHTDIVWAVPVFSPHQARWFTCTPTARNRLKSSHPYRE